MKSKNVILESTLNTAIATPNIQESVYDANKMEGLGIQYVIWGKQFIIFIRIIKEYTFLFTRKSEAYKVNYYHFARLSLWH